MMANLLKQQFEMRYVWMLCVLLSISACQPAPTASRSTQPTHTQIPIIEPTSTEAVIPLPTFELPTATTVATEVTSMLTPNGPWLVYLQNGLTVVNQDGTGQTITERPGDFPVCSLNTGTDIQENLSNRLVIFPRTVYLVQPGPTWTQIYREWPTCDTDFTGDEKSGLLANIYQSKSDAAPELRIYELPSGKLRDQFPLMNCSAQCNTDNVNWWEIKWSPNGRYLAFPAALEGTSSDLYLYDTKNGSTRRLTTGPDDVGTIWWSPNGSQIIMGEIHNSNYPYTASVWVVSLSSGEVRLLYSRDENSYPQGLLGWLDDRRFIVFDGTTLANALDLPAHELRVVDKDTSKVTTLFSGDFMAAALDQTHETVVSFASGDVFMVSTLNPEPKLMSGIRSVPWWDDSVGLFVTYDPCENDPKGIKAFDYRGEWQCILREIPPESLSSPDGTWQVVLRDGFWLKTNDQQSVQVSDEIPTQIIWRQDSGGFFFIANQILYYASLSELDVKTVDKYPGGDSIVYQWVGNN
jgi:hypothetical protein